MNRTVCLHVSTSPLIKIDVVFAEVLLDVPVLYGDWEAEKSWSDVCQMCHRLL